MRVVSHMSRNTVSPRCDVGHEQAPESETTYISYTLTAQTTGTDRKMGTVGGSHVTTISEVTEQGHKTERNFDILTIIKIEINIKNPSNRYLPTTEHTSHLQ